MLRTRCYKWVHTDPLAHYHLNRHMVASRKSSNQSSSAEKRQTIYGGNKDTLILLPPPPNPTTLSFYISLFFNHSIAYSRIITLGFKQRFYNLKTHGILCILKKKRCCFHDQRFSCCLIFTEAQ